MLPTAGPAAPVAKKPNWWLWGCLGCGGLVLLFVLAGVGWMMLSKTVDKKAPVVQHDKAKTPTEHPKPGPDGQSPKSDASGVTVTDLQAAHSVSNDNKPVDPTDTFAGTLQSMYVTFSFEGAKSDTVFSSRVYLDGEHVAALDTDLPTNGVTSERANFHFTFEKPAPPGEYKVDVQVGDEVVATTTFRVEK